jgi:hypothetical protein
MEEWTSVPSGSPWDRKKPQSTHMTTERTNRRQEQEFRMALKRGGFAGPGRRQGEYVKVCRTGNRRVREPAQQGVEAAECPERACVHGPARTRGEPRTQI